MISAIFPFQANGRALSMEAGDDGGFVRVIARKDDHRVLGLQAVGQHVSELSGEFALAIEMGAVLEDIAGTIHVHPTLTEATLKNLGVSNNGSGDTVAELESARDWTLPHLTILTSERRGRLIPAKALQDFGTRAPRDCGGHGNMSNLRALDQIRARRVVEKQSMAA